MNCGGVLSGIRIFPAVIKQLVLDSPKFDGIERIHVSQILFSG
jgi:hypothetical protein